MLAPESSQEPDAWLKTTRQAAAPMTATTPKMPNFRTKETGGADVSAACVVSDKAATLAPLFLVYHTKNHGTKSKPWRSFKDQSKPHHRAVRAGAFLLPRALPRWPATPIGAADESSDPARNQQPTRKRTKTALLEAPAAQYGPSPPRASSLNARARRKLEHQP